MAYNSPYNSRLYAKIEQKYLRSLTGYDRNSGWIKKAAAKRIRNHKKAARRKDRLTRKAILCAELLEYQKANLFS